MTPATCLRAVLTSRAGRVGAGLVGVALVLEVLGTLPGMSVLQLVGTVAFLCGVPLVGWAVAFTLVSAGRARDDER